MTSGNYYSETRDGNEEDLDFGPRSAFLLAIEPQVCVFLSEDLKVFNCGIETVMTYLWGWC